MSKLSGFVHATPGGVIVEVWVVPRSSRDEITGLHGDALRVRVAAPPERGRANSAAASVLVEILGGRSGEVVSGATSRRKRIRVAGVTKATALQILEALVGR